MKLQIRNAKRKTILGVAAFAFLLLPLGNTYLSSNISSISSAFVFGPQPISAGFLNGTIGTAHYFKNLSVARRRKSFWESQSMFPTLFPDVKLELLDRSLQRLVLCGYSYLHMLVFPFSEQNLWAPHHKGSQHSKEK